MINTTNMPDILKRIGTDLRAFLSYLASLWGILSAFSAFFPLINKVRDLLPAPRVAAAGQELTVVLSSLSCAFIIFYQFTARDESEPHRPRAWKMFLLALGMAMFYVFVLPDWPRVPLEQLLKLKQVTAAWQTSLGAIRAFLTTLEPVLYVAIFSALTYAFTLLAVLEYRRKRSNS